VAHSAASTRSGPQTLPEPIDGFGDGDDTTTLLLRRKFPNLRLFSCYNTGVFEPDFDGFRRLAAGGGKVPIHRTILADLETPVSAYWKLAHDRAYSFLLESVVGGERVGRFSFLGAGPRTVLRSKGRNARIIEAGAQHEIELAEGRDPLHVLKELVGPVQPHDPALPPFLGGAVGYLSYDLVRFFERLPDSNPDDIGADDCCMMLCDAVVAFDHAKRNMMVIVNAAAGTDPRLAYDKACAEIDDLVRRLREPLPALPHSPSQPSRFRASVSRDAYEAAVARTKQYIEAGDGVQMVISQRFSSPLQAAPINVYRALRALNPSPYMFLLDCDDMQVIGGSPEVLVTLQGRTATVRPIAGTRARGETAEEDERLERELLADEKERAEHLMLVDLGRNDLGRVCEFGSVKVNSLMHIERYSHVMHIVSDVTGTLRTGLDAYDLIRAAFPAGTVSGAPKIRAMEIIEELETSRRGPYAGAVGYFGYGGDMDTCITIRSVVVKDGQAHVQAGAGIVADSVPEREWEECANKAEAVIRAVDRAQRGLD
jgi:anthranilate synthase component 1